MVRYLAVTALALAMAGCVTVRSGTDGPEISFKSPFSAKAPEDQSKKLCDDPAGGVGGVPARKVPCASLKPPAPPTAGAAPKAPPTEEAPAPVPKPAAPAAAAPSSAPAAAGVRELPLEAFPSSKNTTSGKTWTEMGKFPFTGTLDQAIGLMQIPDEKKKLFREIFAGGKCQRYHMKEGEKFALDGLTFSVGGVHKVRGKVAVELNNPSSRWVMICHLGQGLYAGQYEGCKNFWWSFSFPPKLVEVKREVSPAPKPAASAQGTAKCPAVIPEGMQGYMANIWDWDSFPPQLQDRVFRLIVKSDGMILDSVSEQLGAVIRAAEKAGTVKRWTQPVKLVYSNAMVSDAGVHSNNVLIKEHAEVRGGVLQLLSKEQYEKEVVVTGVAAGAFIVSPAPTLPSGENWLRLQYKPSCGYNLHFLVSRAKVQIPSLAGG